MEKSRRPTRRHVIAALALTPAAVLATRPSAAQQPPTPQCAEPGDATPSQIAGPYYKPEAPLRRDLRASGGAGEPMDLAGRVLDVRCRPLEGAVVEIWHADPQGRYDNQGFRLRGHQLADAEGYWAFDTLVTRHYAQRTAHYHFRVRHPGYRVLTTQLYFPDYPRNASDRMFDPRLVMRLARGTAHRSGSFDFVLRS